MAEETFASCRLSTFKLTHHNVAQQIIMANDMDDFLVGSPSKFEWQRQSSSASSTAQVETDGVDSHCQLDPSKQYIC
eukprot:scaffold3893_cov89-Skeletonema_dohrnii-CCMP3373.AAC.3